MNEEQLKKFEEDQKNEVLEVLKPEKEVKETKLKEFYKKFGRQLKNNMGSFISPLGSCLDLMRDSFKTNDEIGERIIGLLGQDFEAAFYLLEHRQVICNE